MQRFYKPNELAEMLQLTPERIANLVQAGQVRGYLIDGEMRIGEEDLEQYLASCIITTPVAIESNGLLRKIPQISADSGSEVPKQCRTFGGQATFTYTGSVPTGTTIWPGQKTSYKMRFVASQWAALLEEFRGKEVRAGLNFSHPESGSFGAWIKLNWNTKMGPAAYVGGILVHEGYAQRPRPGWITILKEESAHP
jgi:hypothetical protein